MVRRITKECLDRFLPFEALIKGFGLDWWSPESEPDPVILSRRGQELYRWDYIPSLTEVFEKCRELMEANNG